MRKWLAVLLTLGVLLSVAACTSPFGSEPETEPGSEPEADDETLVIRFLWIPIAAAAAVAGVIVAARLHRKKKASANAQAQTQPEQTEDAGTNA